MSAADLVALLVRYRFDESSEDALQRGVASVLAEHGIAHVREVNLCRGDRIDFMVGSLGLECKIAGSLSSVTRQLHRYAHADQVEALVLVTTSARLGAVPRMLNGKQLVVVATLGGLR